MSTAAGGAMTVQPGWRAAFAAVILVATGCAAAITSRSGKARVVAAGVSSSATPAPSSPMTSARRPVPGRPEAEEQPRPMPLPATSADPAVPAPPKETTPTQVYRLVGDNIVLTINGRKAALYTTHGAVVNPILIRLPYEECPADAFDVMPGPSSWTLLQAHCGGSVFYSDQLTFTYPSAKRPSVLVSLQVWCANRFHLGKDGDNLNIFLKHPGSDFGSPTFEEVDLDAIYEQLDFSGCYPPPEERQE